MKQFYKYILTLTTIFIATSLSAQTYNNGTWYSLWHESEFELYTIANKTFDVFPPTNGALVFNWTYDGVWGSRSHTTKIYESSNGGSSYTEKGKVEGRNTDYPSANIAVSKNINKIKFDRETGNTWSAYYKNIKLPLAKHILLDDGTTYGTTHARKTFPLTTFGSYSKITINLRSFLTKNANGINGIKITSSNNEFHFEDLALNDTKTFNIPDNSCASANGADNTPCSNGVLGDIDLYSFDIYFTPYKGTTTCTATITITDGTSTATIDLSAPATLYQTIIWDQSFMAINADKNGYINQTIPLTAYAVDIQQQPTNNPIIYSSNNTNVAEIITNSDGTYSLHIKAIGSALITATTQTHPDYLTATAMREVRVRRLGASCGSYSLYIVNEVAFSGWGVISSDKLVYPLEGLPDSNMEFYAHTATSSINNKFHVDFSTDNATWTNRQSFNLTDTYDWQNPYRCTVPANAKYVRFETESSLNTYFNMVSIRQKEYLTPSVPEIVISDAIVNQPFSATFTVDYSDVPFIQYEVTNNHNLNIQLTPSSEINNNCGEHGTYTFTLTGMSPYPQENVQETITIFTSAGHRVEIPVIITSKLGDPYYFNQQDGNWNDLNNWRVNNTKPSQLPTPSNPVIIEKSAITGTADAPFEGIAYSITIAEGGSLTVLPKGGLTVHAGGFTGANENNLTLHNMQSGAGFIRISPYFTREVEGTMPKIKVLYQTRSTLDTGANKDATWQYIGAPGNNTTIYVDYNTWLYKLDEQNADWVLQPRTANVALEPFEGYAITQYGQPTYQWTADITNENHTLPLTYSKDGRDGRHIFANSYTAPIDVKALHNAITYAEGQESRFRIDQTVYIFNSGSWNAWNSVGQTASGSTPGQYYAIPILAAAADYLSSDEQTVIPPMQGFYMRVRSKTPMNELNSNEHVGHIQLDYNRLVMSNIQIDNTPLRSPQRVEDTSDFQRARIHVTSATSGADRLIVIQDTICTRKYNNGYDAPNQTTEGLANIYTNESFGKMEVSCSDNIDSLYIGFMAGEDSYYTLHFSAMCGEIYLKDLANDSIILMQDGGQYHFTATPNSTNDLRFQILLDPDFDPSNGNGDILSDTEGAPSTQVWMHGNTIYIASAPSNSVAKLFNVSGHMIMNAPITYSPYTLDLSHLTPGVYMLQLNNQTYKFIRQ